MDKKLSSYPKTVQLAKQVAAKLGFTQVKMGMRAGHPKSRRGLPAEPYLVMKLVYEPGRRYYFYEELERLQALLDNISPGMFQARTYNEAQNIFSEDICITVPVVD